MKKLVKESLNETINEAKGLFYIGERQNPQLKKSYFIAYGILSKKEARKKEDTAYGSIWMTAYNDKESYNDAIEKLRADGFTVNVRS